LREASAMLAPAAPSAKAIALPSPLLPPVMTATLPFRLYSLIPTFQRRIQEGCRLPCARQKRRKLEMEFAADLGRSLEYFFQITALGKSDR
jgi:hypothetical protein